MLKIKNEVTNMEETEINEEEKMTVIKRYIQLFIYIIKENQFLQVVVFFYHIDKNYYRETPNLKGLEKKNMEGYMAMSFFCYFVRLNNRAIFQNNLVASDCYYLNIEKYIEPILYINLYVFFQKNLFIVCTFKKNHIVIYI